MVSETRKESMAWMEHGSQISLKRHALSMENELAAGAVEKLNYIVSKEYENKVALWQLTKCQEFTNPYFNISRSAGSCVYSGRHCSCANAFLRSIPLVRPSTYQGRICWVPLLGVHPYFRRFQRGALWSTSNV